MDDEGLTASDERNDSDLDPTGLKILSHWRQHRPRMCAQLEKEGKLVATVKSVQDLVIDTEYDLHLKGVPWANIKEITRSIWALPTEPGDPATGEARRA